MTTKEELRQELTLIKTNLLNFETKLDEFEEESGKKQYCRWKPKDDEDVYGEITYRCAEEDMENCYYKQLQRKTAECEKLKSALEEIEKFCYRGVGNCDGNEAECNISLILDLINKAKEQE